MRSTTRTYLYERDVTEWIEWGTPCGCVSFDPIDKNYRDGSTGDRLFTITIGEPYSDTITKTGTAKELTRFHNQLVKENSQY